MLMDTSEKSARLHEARKDVKQTCIVLDVAKILACISNTYQVIGILRKDDA